jgi:hypothetical protein
MLYDVAEDAGSLSRTELRRTYDRRLVAAIEAVGAERAATEAGVAREHVDALLDDESPDLTLEEAAALLALDPDVRDAETVVLETRDDLLMGMTTGVMDVDAVAGDIEVDLTGQEVQQAIEGRTMMTLDQLAAIHRAIAARN